jgi:toxin ParE1/3/4
MKIKVMKGAIADMRDIHYYIAHDNTKDVADAVILKIKGLISSLKELPNRGNYVKELSSIGSKQYRELHYKPYRIVYSVENDIFVHAVIDGRRDVYSALINRLIQS